MHRIISHLDFHLDFMIKNEINLFLCMRWLVGWLLNLIDVFENYLNLWKLNGL